MASVEPRAEPEDVAHVTDASGTSRARTTVPELPPSTVGRPVVEALVAAAATRRLTLVSAGPGWGRRPSRPGGRTAAPARGSRG